MEFLNPGFLGTQAEFRRRFFVPIQASRDPEAATRLKRLTGPFMLRRLKTDKSIIADLPDKLEMKVFCKLTKRAGVAVRRRGRGRQPETSRTPRASSARALVLAR